MTTHKAELITRKSVYLQRVRINDCEMNAGQFGNYARGRGCEVKPHSNENIIWIVNPKNGASCYVMCRYKSIYYDSIAEYCTKLGIEIISRKDYESYE
jgi:hypothetical protein